MNKTKIIVSAGLSVAIYAIFFLVSLYSGGILESTLFFLLPIPLAIFTYKYGFKYALIPYISIGLIGYFINPISTLFYVLTANVVGVVYGALLKKNKSIKIRLLLCIVSTFIVDLFSMIIFASLLDYSINEEIYEIFKFLLNVLGLNIDKYPTIQNLIIASIPVFLVFMSVVEGYLIHISICFAMKRLKLIEFNFRSIYFISLPVVFSILQIVFLLIHIFTFKFVFIESGFIKILSIIILDIFWILNLILFVQGFLRLTLLSTQSKFRYVYLIITLACLLLIPLIYIFVVSVLGNIFVFSDYKKHLLYNNK